MNIISYSGGKDSTAMLLHMIELNYPIDKIIFADTTLEYPEMYEWIEKIESIIGKKIIHVKCAHTFDSWFYGTFTKGRFKGRIRGFPYTVNKCWWSRDGKIVPMKKHQGKNNHIYLGIAYDEKERANSKQYKIDSNTYEFPLIDWKWTENEYINYLIKHNLKHPLYNKFKRTGCWLCPKQSLNSLENLYRYYPELWKRLKQYEKDSPHGFKPNFSLDEFEERINKKLKIRTLDYYDNKNPERLQ